MTLEWIHQATTCAWSDPRGPARPLPHRPRPSRRLQGRYFTAIDLVEHLYRSVADNTVGKAIEAVSRNDLIIIDEVGFDPLDHIGCQLFRLVSAAHDRRSIAIASHTPFEQWGKFLPDQPTAVSLLDRLCHHVHIVTTTGDSHRLRHRTGGPTTT